MGKNRPVTAELLFFEAPAKVKVREKPLPAPGPGVVLVRSLYSAISPGTEMLVYRGQFPEEEAVDTGIASLSGDFAYPIQYGYSTVGEVTAVGPGVDEAWLGRCIFAFHPHASHFLALQQDLIPVPEDISPEAAVFLPNAETAVNLVMDGRPALGEVVVVFGQGVVGLLTAGLLTRFPLAALLTLDRYECRQQASLALGVTTSFDPAHEDWRQRLLSFCPQLSGPGNAFPGADLCFELSGVPAALQSAIEATGFAGRVVVGSWYGRKEVGLQLGGRFHRGRIRLISSQVSTLDPRWSGRWDKARRFGQAWELIRRVQPSRWISHRFPLSQAAEAYQMIDREPEMTIQVIFEY